MKNYQKTSCLALVALALSSLLNTASAQDAPTEVVTVQKSAATQASTDALLQHLLIMTNAQTQNARSRIGNEDTPLSRTTQKPIEALTFMQNHVHIKKVNVFSFTGLDLEVIGRVLVNERDKSERVGTILLAEKNYASGKPGIFVPRLPFAYINLDQVDSLIVALNEIAKESNMVQQYPTEITYVAEGGLMVQYYGVANKVLFKNVAPSDRISNFDNSISKVSSYGYHSIEIKAQKELPQIINALKRAKADIERYMHVH